MYMYQFFRIILAMDLEMWYLWSLKFISVIKILSPKVFMARNMVSLLRKKNRHNTLKTH